MPIPLVPVAAAVGLGALLFAGSKGSAAPAADGGGADAPSTSATPTQASTGGDAGGAQYPAHADVDTAVVAGGLTRAETPILTPPSDPWVVADDPGTMTAGRAEPAFEASANEPIASGVAAVAGGALGSQAGQLAGATTRYIGKTFETWGEALGAIW